MIKLDALRVFVMVADLGNIKDAAEQLCRTPSAVSMTLKQLETEIGGPLFETDRKSHLTALGQFTWQTAKQEITSYDRALDRIGAYAQNKSGRIILASVPSVATTVIPSILPEFLATRPNAEVELIDSDSRTVARRIDSGKADLGFGGRPLNDNSAEFEPLFYDKFVVVCSNKSSLFQVGPSVRWESLKSQTLINNGASDVIEAEAFVEMRKTAKMRVVNVLSLLAMVREGLGITLLPALAAKHLPAGLASIAISDYSIEREVGLLTRRSTTMTPLAHAFRQHILENRAVISQKFGLKVF